MKNIVFLNGEFIESSKAKISVFDHGFLYGDGVYETLLVKNKKILFWDEHWSRLKNSICITHLKLDFSSDELRKISEKLVQKNNFSDARLRITLTRGKNSFQFSTCKNPTLLVSLFPLESFPSEIYKEGVDVSCINLERVLPKVKSISMLVSSMARKKKEEKGVFEVIFVTKEKFLREGSVSNVFVKTKDKIWIAPKETVLSGTMLNTHLQEFQKEGLKVLEKDFTLEDIKKANGELYLSNSLFGIVRVREIIL